MNTTFDRLNKSIKRLNDSLDLKISYSLSRERFIERLRIRFKGKLKQLHLGILPYPPGQLSGDELLRRVLHRKPPFSGEKDEGIKDYLILDSLKQLCKERAGKKVVFLCRDGELCKAVDLDLVKNREVVAYRSLDAYESFLRLRIDDEKEEWIQDVIKRAKKKFYDAPSQTGIFFSERVLERIQQAHGEVLCRDLINPRLFGLAYSGVAVSNADWQYFVNVPYIVDRDQKSTRFQSGIKLTRDYGLLDEQEFTGSGSGLYTFLLHLELSVVWAARITTDKRFRKPEITDIKFENIWLQDLHRDDSLREFLTRPREKPSLADLMHQLARFSPAEGD